MKLFVGTKVHFQGSLSWIFEYNSIQDGETDFDAEFSNINTTAQPESQRYLHNVSHTWSDKILRYNDAMRVSEI